MAENEQSGFHEGVTIPVIPVKPVGAGSSIHTDVTVVMPKTAGGGEHNRCEGVARVGTRGMRWLFT